MTNCKCELIENYPCNSSVELHRREGELQISLACINKSVAGRTDKEYKKYYRSLEVNRERENELNRIRRKKANYTEEEWSKMMLKKKEYNHTKKAIHLES